VTVGGSVASLVVTRTDPVGTAYAVNITDASIPNGAPVAITVASRNDFYAGRTTWKQTQSSGVPAGAPLLSGAAPVATPSLTDGTTATFSWGNVFGDNGKAISAYYAAVFEGAAMPNCTVTDVDTGAPQLHVDPTSASFVKTGAQSTTFGGLQPNHAYSFVVYAYNGQGCTRSAIVTAVPRAAPGPATGVTVSARPVTSGDGLYDFSLEAVAHRAGSGTSTVVNYRIDGQNGVSESGSIAGTSGLLTGQNGQHYGTQLTLVITSICERYDDGSTLCSDPGAAPYTTPIGVAVSTRIGGQHFDAPSNTFTWNSWPTGSYSSVTYSCGNGVQLPMPLIGQTASCTATSPAPDLDVTVRVGGDTYTQRYPSGGMG
jgi:hypothetical protein